MSQGTSRLDDLCQSRGQLAGYQLFRRDLSEVLSVAGGVDFAHRPLSADGVAPSYCLGKLPVALTIALLAHRGDVRMTDRISEYVSVPWVAEPTSVLDVINHCAGLVSPNSMEWRLAPPSERNHLLPTSPPAASCAYSDFLGGYTLELLIEKVCRRRASTAITEDLLRPAGVSGGLCWGDSLPASPDVLPPIAGLPERWIPLLSETLAGQIADVTPSLGAYCSARGMGQLLAGAVLGLGWSGDPQFPQFVREQLLTGIEGGSEYSLGFVTDLGGRGIDLTGCGRVVGHDAAVGSGLALVDLDNMVAVSVYGNGAPMNLQSLKWIRNELLGAALGRVPSVEDPAPPNMTEELSTWPIDCVAPHRGCEPITMLNDRLGVGQPLADLSYSVRFEWRTPFARVGLTASFVNGILAKVGEDRRAVDTALCFKSEAALTDWLSTPTSTLGALLASDDLDVDGEFWHLSPLEAWAATCPS